MTAANRIKQCWQDALLKAYLEAEPIVSPSATYGELSVEQAYEIQSRVVESRVAEGERIIGWKVGSTSQAVMKQLGIEEPVYGCMTSGSSYPAWSEVSASRFCKLAIEGEIAVVMREPLRGPGVTLADAIFATAGVMAAVELVDSRIKDWKMRPSEAVADNALHAGVILGPIVKPIPGMNLRQEGVIISKNGRHLASACGVEALGHPLNVVAWLANKLSGSEREIQSGEVILTGSLTQFFFVESGDVVDVTFSNLGQIQFAIVE